MIAQTAGTWIANAVTTLGLLIPLVIKHLSDRKQAEKLRLETVAQAQRVQAEAAAQAERVRLETIAQAERIRDEAVAQTDKIRAELEAAKRAVAGVQRTADAVQKTTAATEQAVNNRVIGEPTISEDVTTLMERGTGGQVAHALPVPDGEAESEALLPQMQKLRADMSLVREDLARLRVQVGINGPRGS